MQDYTIQRCTKRCRKSNRVLAPGESYFAVVESKNASTIRYDIACSEWTEPPANAIAWWKSRMPDNKLSQRKPTPNAVLLRHLSNFCDDPRQQTIAYLLAMLLVRRKVLEYTPSSSGDGEEWLGFPNDEGIVLRSVGDGDEYRVLEPPASLPPESLQQLQTALHDLLVHQADLEEPEAIEPTPDDLEQSSESHENIELAVPQYENLDDDHESKAA